MAYTDFGFYQTSFLGDLFTEGNVFQRWEQRASDYLDTITFKRLINGLPTDKWNNKRVQKCVCALAEIFYQLKMAQDNANATMIGSSICVDEKVETENNIKSKSSGSESITYMTRAEMANGAKEWSAIYAAAGSQVATNELLMQTAKEYLSGVSDDSGTLLLYAGM